MFSKFNKIFKYGYEAVKSMGRRRQLSSYVKAEERVLRNYDWKRVINGTYDSIRNTTLIKFLVNKHLDYVATHHLHVIEGAPDDIHNFLRVKLTKLLNSTFIDVSKRFNLHDIVRMVEMSVVMTGDGFLYKPGDGKLQLIEADRVTKPTNCNGEDLIEVNEMGLVLDPYGSILKYCICDRDPEGTNYTFQKLVEVKDMICVGEYIRPDQLRGVSPLVSALNSVTDLHETLEYTLLKIKLHSLFGIAFKRESPKTESSSTWDKTGYPDGEYASSGNSVQPHTVELKNGLMTLELAPSESVDVIESKTPSSQMLDFTELTIRLIMLALDMPYTVYNSMGSSYDARLADRAEYEESLYKKRLRVRNVLNDATLYILENLQATDPVFKKLLKTNKLTVGEVADMIEWVSAGVPWIDKLKEVSGDEKAIALGIDSRQRACRRRGTDFWQIVDELKTEEEYMANNGVSYAIGKPGQALITGENSENAEVENIVKD